MSCGFLLPSLEEASEGCFLVAQWWDLKGWREGSGGKVRREIGW